MPYYKNDEDDLYWIDSEEFEHVIPAGYVKITNEEAEPILELHRNPPPTAELVRTDRNARLAATDWSQLPDVPQSIKDLWAPYRQANNDRYGNGGIN